MAAATAPGWLAKLDDERLEIGQQLWPSYTVLADSASFLAATLRWASQSMGAVTVADMLRPGAPLIYVNDCFTELCGYSREEANALRARGSVRRRQNLILRGRNRRDWRPPIPDRGWDQSIANALRALT